MPDSPTPSRRAVGIPSRGQMTDPLNIVMARITMLPTMDGRAEILCSRGVKPKRLGCLVIRVAAAQGGSHDEARAGARGAVRML